MCCIKSDLFFNKIYYKNDTAGSATVSYKYGRY